MKKIILVSIITVGISGCSTSAVNPSVAKSAPKDRITLYQMKNDNSASVTVVRDSGMVGSGCFATVFVNGKEAARLDTSEKATFYVDAGQHIIGSVLDGKGLCSFGGARQERDIDVKSGDIKYYRIFTDQNGNMDIKATTLN